MCGQHQKSRTRNRLTNTDDETRISRRLKKASGRLSPGHQTGTSLALDNSKSQSNRAGDRISTSVDATGGRSLISRRATSLALGNLIVWTLCFQLYLLARYGTNWLSGDAAI